MGISDVHIKWIVGICLLVALLALVIGLGVGINLGNRSISNQEKSRQKWEKYPLLKDGVQYLISRQWDSRPTGHDPIKVTLHPGEGEVIMDIEGPFFNSPPNPGGTPGEPFQDLWAYEVVEAFFLADDGKYLEAEFCPHGQHFLLLLNESKIAIKELLPCNFTSIIEGETWHGRAVLPADYFPPNVTRWNAYAIHGEGEKRMYKALYPVPTGKHEKANFHRLEYFEKLDFPKLLPSNEGADLSKIWRDNMK